MTRDTEEEIWGWRQLLGDRNWPALNDWIGDPRHWTSKYKPALAVLLTELQALVPLIDVENGMERTARRLRPTDPDEMWERLVEDNTAREDAQEAAIILHLGELEAVVEGDPLPARESWPARRKDTEKHLHAYLEEPEPTSGDRSFSRRAHAMAALDRLADIDFIERVAQRELSDFDSQTWLSELLAEVAFTAFEAGRHVQAAWSKEFEPFVPTGMKLQKAQRDGGATRRNQIDPRSKLILNEMQRLVDVGHSVKRAGEICFKNGLGASGGANKKMYTRRKKKLGQT